MENIAIITAGGIGSRTFQSIPKQFISVNDKPIIIYTLEAFQKHPDIDAIIVVCLSGWEDFLNTYASKYGITKLKCVVVGGASNYESIKNGLYAAKGFCKDDDLIIIHDGNRPLLSGAIISNSIACAKEFGNAVACIPTTEVVFMNDDTDTLKLLNRDRLIRTQTPHALSLKLALELFERAEREKNIEKSAVCSLLLQFGYPIHFVKGSMINFKITYQEELEIFKSMVQLEKDK